jgi:hypothetical protein
VAVGAATALTGLGVAHASPDLSASPAPLTGTGHVITLITGDRVLLRADGNYSVLAAPGSTGALDTFQNASGDRYFVPVTALPYYSAGLDPSLFDTNALVAAGATNQVPLTLTFAPGSTPTAPPGVTLTSVSDATATGYLSTTGGPAFAAALRATVGADHAAGRPIGSTPLVPGLTDISLAGAATVPVATPHYPLHILTINANDLTGKPVAGADVLLVNADNVRTADVLVPIENGLDKVAVPAGNYTAIGLFDDFDASGNFLAARTTVQELSVPDTGTATATINESTATAKVGFTVPKPATAQYQLTTFTRLDAAGNAAGFGEIDFGPPPPTYVSPAPAAAIGKLDYLVQWGGSGPASQNYRYDVAFGSANGIPAQEQDNVSQDQVATVTDRFSADPAATSKEGSLLVGASDPALASVGGSAIGYGAPMPGDTTDYLASTVGGLWSQQSFGSNNVVLIGDVHTYQARHDYRVDWSHGPLAATFGQHTGFQECLACAAGSTLSLIFSPVGDSDPTHAGLLFTQPTSSHFTLYRNGTSVFDQDGYDGTVLDNVPAGPATYRAVFDLDMSGVAGFSQSTVAHTDLTLRYDPKTASPLPAPSVCQGQTASTPCTILPALSLNYQLATDENNTSTSPVQVLNLTVGHLSYDGAGSRAPITGASVQVSFDKGTTWQHVPVLGFAGHYVALWHNTAGTSPSIKVTATDAAGGSITQTVTNAYTTGSATQ